MAAQRSAPAVGTQELYEPGSALFWLSRSIPRSVGQVTRDASATSKALQQILVVDAIDLDQRSGSTPIVGSVAVRLRIDPSTASRLVGDAVRSGHVLRVATQSDARRVGLTLTRKGRELLTESRRHQQEVFEQLTAGWPDRDRSELGRLLVKLLDSQTSTRSAARAPGEAL
jgi:DNA-binding MarR family transcriptional regulator